MLEVIYVPDIILMLAPSQERTASQKLVIRNKLIFKGVYERSWTVAAARSFTPGKERLKCSEGHHETPGKAARRWLRLGAAPSITWPSHSLSARPVGLSSSVSYAVALSPSDSHGAGGCLTQTPAPATFSRILVFLLIAPADPQRHNRGSNKQSSSLLKGHYPQLALQFLCAKERKVESK